MLLALLAVGLNVSVGWAGLLDLGFVAFYGFGAYTFALLRWALVLQCVATAATAMSSGTWSPAPATVTRVPSRG